MTNHVLRGLGLATLVVTILLLAGICIVYAPPPPHPGPPGPPGPPPPPPHPHPPPPPGPGAGNGFIFLFTKSVETVNTRFHVRLIVREEGRDIVYACARAGDTYSCIISVHKLRDVIVTSVMYESTRLVIEFSNLNMQLTLQKNTLMIRLTGSERILGKVCTNNECRIVKNLSFNENVQKIINLSDDEYEQLKTLIGYIMLGGFLRNLITRYGKCRGNTCKLVKKINTTLALKLNEGISKIRFMSNLYWLMRALMITQPGQVRIVVKLVPLINITRERMKILYIIRGPGPGPGPPPPGPPPGPGPGPAPPPPGPGPVKPISGEEALRYLQLVYSLLSICAETPRTIPTLVQT